MVLEINVHIRALFKYEKKGLPERAVPCIFS